MGKGEGKKARQAKETEALSPLYLEHVKMTSFGRFANAIIGPFGPGMNVVLGPNEAGKTTINELVKGVLFGWPSGRKVDSNPYRPEAADRAGSLFFHDTQTDEVVEVTRSKAVDAPTFPAPLLSDIDKDTYETMFALTSDELMRLDRHSDVTARLLTAGSGTSSSPARALDVINAQIADLMSRSSQLPDSITNLRAEQAQVRDEKRAGLEEADRFRGQEVTLAALHPRQETLHHTQDVLNDEIEHLTAERARLESLDGELAQTRASLEAAESAAQGARDDAAAAPPEEIAPLVGLSQADEYRLKDALDDFDDQRSKLEHAADSARHNATKSRADYEVAMEDTASHAASVRAHTQRTIRLACAVVVPLVMIALGAYLIFRVSSAGSLSYLMLGVAIVIFALVISAAGISMSLKPTRAEEEISDERKKKEWVMQQDRKTVEACERDIKECDERIEGFLVANGLAAAHGSVRRARRLLDQAREFRASAALSRQNERAVALQRAELEKTLAEVQHQRTELCRGVGVDPLSAGEDIERMIERKSDERRQTTQLAHDTERQIGEITQQLAQARHLMGFDEAKFKEEAVKTRLSEQYRRLALLLIARRSLESAIADWERKSQPKVYATASRLFEMMTGGAWRQVRMNAKGDIEVVDAIKTTREPRYLSLGTRQQLYLSLRIALLLTAENVGRGLPIMCDDILVNFDDDRRAQAARALVELSRRRQVILFTCHPDIAALVSEADPQSIRLEL